MNYYMDVLNLSNIITDLLFIKYCYTVMVIKYYCRCASDRLLLWMCWLSSIYSGGLVIMDVLVIKYYYGCAGYQVLLWMCWLSSIIMDVLVIKYYSCTAPSCRHSRQ